MSALERALRWFVVPAQDEDAPVESSPATFLPPLAATGPNLAPFAPSRHIPPAGPAPPPRPSPQPRPAPLPPAAEVISTAAVLGRSGEAEPVAAAVALVLRRGLRARAATVVLPGAGDEPERSGAGATRKLVRRLEAQGLVAEARGRLALVHAGGDLDVARRAAHVATPAVLAVTAPRTPALDALLADQDLVVVVARDEDGPLTRLAGEGLAVPVVVVPPLPRGFARALAAAGRTAPRTVRDRLEAR